MKFASTIIFIISIMVYSNLQSQCCWIFQSEGKSISFDFGVDTFNVDTTKTIEGNFYIITFVGNYGYILVNKTISNTSLPCCNNKDKYLAKDSLIYNGLDDKRGIISESNLYWREIKYKGYHLTYSYFLEQHVGNLDKLFNNIIEQIKKMPE